MRTRAAPIALGSAIGSPTVRSWKACGPRMRPICCRSGANTRARMDFDERRGMGIDNSSVEYGYPTLPQLHSSIRYLSCLPTATAQHTIFAICMFCILLNCGCDSLKIDFFKYSYGSQNVVANGIRSLLM